MPPMVSPIPPVFEKSTIHLLVKITGAKNANRTKKIATPIKSHERVSNVFLFIFLNLFNLYLTFN